MKKSILLIMVMALLVLTGCQTAEITKLSSIEEKKVLVLGTSADYPPYEFHKEIDGVDTIVGFDIDIAKGIADELGVELKIIDMKFEGLLPALQAGKIDLIVAGMTPTEERKQNVDFSIVYYDSNQTMLVKKSDENILNTIESFKGKTIGVQKATIQEDLAIEKFTESTVQSLGKIPNLVMSLQSGKVDTIILAETVAQSYANANEDLTLNGIDLGNEGGVAIAISKDSGEFLDELNIILTKMIEDGTVDKFITEATVLSGE